MTKRQAILAGAAATIGLMSGRAKTEPVAAATWPQSEAGIYNIRNVPQTVTFSLDTFEKFTFTHAGKSVTITGAELFEALSSP